MRKWELRWSLGQAEGGGRYGCCCLSVVWSVCEGSVYMWLTGLPTTQNSELSLKCLSSEFLNLKEIL